MSRFFIFNNSEEFNNAYVGLPKPNISICKGLQSIIYTPEEYYNFCDILYSDSNGNLSVSSEVLPVSEGRIPIALCIVPTYAFGLLEKARWISLKYMSLDTPNTGTVEVQGFKEEFSSIYRSNYKIAENFKLTKDTSGNNGKTINDTSNTNYPVIPTFFNELNRWNKALIGEGYLLSNIIGYENTQIVKDNMITNNISYLTDDLRNSEDQYALGFKTCLRYNTLGTNQGDWYFGSIGEFLYLIENYTVVNEKIQQINALYPTYCMSSIIVQGSGYAANNIKDQTTSMCFLLGNGGKSQMTSLMSYTSRAVLGMLQY